MTASFLDQMLTIYIHLGMLSRGKFYLFVMRGLDPRICRVKEDGRVKPGHDGVGKSGAGSEVFAGMTRMGRGSHSAGHIDEQLGWAGFRIDRPPFRCEIEGAGRDDADQIHQCVHFNISPRRHRIGR